MKTMIFSYFRTKLFKKTVKWQHPSYALVISRDFLTVEKALLVFNKTLFYLVVMLSRVTKVVADQGSEFSGY